METVVAIILGLGVAAFLIYLSESPRASERFDNISRRIWRGLGVVISRLSWPWPKRLAEAHRYPARHRKLV